MRLALNLLVLFFLLFTNARAADYARVCFHRTLCLQAEIADTDETRKNGLMFRERSDQGQAMLFVFDAEVLPSFWLKNVKFPLDIIWIKADKTIADIKTDCQPCVEDCQSYVPVTPAKYAIEVPAGFVEKNQIKAGDRLSFNLP